MGAFLVLLVVISGGHSYNGKPIENNVQIVEQAETCIEAAEQINKRVGHPVADCIFVKKNTNENPA